MNLFWLLLIIPGSVWLAGVCHLWMVTIAVSLAGDDFWWGRFLSALGMALIWPLWCWRLQ